jgi:hypothetical protein
MRYLVRITLFLSGFCFTVQKMALSQTPRFTIEHEREFAHQLMMLCRKYGLFVKEQRVRRESPERPVVFVDYLVSAKVDSSEDVTLI